MALRTDCCKDRATNNLRDALLACSSANPLHADGSSTRAAHGLICPGTLWSQHGPKGLPGLRMCALGWVSGVRRCSLRLQARWLEDSFEGIISQSTYQPYMRHDHKQSCFRYSCVRGSNAAISWFVMSCNSRKSAGQPLAVSRLPPLAPRLGCDFFSLTKLSSPAGAECGGEVAERERFPYQSMSPNCNFLARCLLRELPDLSCRG